MLNNTTTFNRRLKTPSRFNTIDIGGVYEINSKHLILIDDRPEVEEVATKIVNAWNKAGKTGVYVDVQHNESETKNVYFLKDSKINKLVGKKGESTYDKTFKDFIKEYTSKYKITKFGNLDCTTGKKSPQSQPTVFFDGLGTGNVRPSDIDSVIIEGDLLIFMEVKTGGGTLSYGQQLVMERIVNAWKLAGGVALGLLVKEKGYHKGDILAENCKIERYYKDGKWHEVCRELVEGLDSIIKTFSKKKTLTY